MLVAKEAVAALGEGVDLVEVVLHALLLLEGDVLGDLLGLRVHLAMDLGPLHVVIGLLRVHIYLITSLFLSLIHI